MRSSIYGMKFCCQESKDRVVQERTSMEVRDLLDSVTTCTDALQGLCVSFAVPCAASLPFPVLLSPSWTSVPFICKTPKCMRGREIAP